MSCLPTSGDEDYSNEVLLSAEIDCINIYPGSVVVYRHYCERVEDILNMFVPAGLQASVLDEIRRDRSLCQNIIDRHFPIVTYAAIARITCDVGVQVSILCESDSKMIERARHLKYALNLLDDERGNFKVVMTDADPGEHMFIEPFAQ